MDEVIVALGWPPGRMSKARVVVTVCAITTLFVVGGYFLATLTHWPLVLVHAALWVPWLIWLGYRFPNHHLRHAEIAGGYRRAFFLHVAPGISANFSQMSRPALVGVLGLRTHPLHALAVVVGLVLIVAGNVMIADGLRAIGVARALFLGEYESVWRKLVVSGIYRWVRHPLFVGGMVVSLGISVLFWTPATLGLAAANAMVLPAYSLVEDRRCRRVHPGYATYQAAVGGVVPTKRAPFELVEPLIGE